MTLRARLALLFGAVGLFVSVLVGLLAFRATEGEFDEATDSFLTTRAEEIGRGTRGGPAAGRPNRPRPDGDAGSANENGGESVQLPFDADAVAQTVTKDGTVLSSSLALPITSNTDAMISLAPRGIDAKNSRFDDIVLGGVPYRMISLALPDGGAVQVARATSEDDDVLSTLVIRFGLIAAAVAFVGALLGWVIARRATSPLRRLAEVATDVAATRDFTTEVDVESTDEIGQLAESFRTMLDALEQSREQQHRLVHDAGHELRTPLTSLRANAAMLDRFEQLGETDRREIVDAVQSELVELSDLFTELIELATDQRSEHLSLAALDLDAVVRDVADRWQRRTGRRIDVVSESAMVSGDATMLDRAINNLLSNADKFSPPDSTITVTAASGRVSVRDAGPGVSPEDRARIFDRFYRSEATRSMPGSGLGLAIVAQIIERHGGSVFVDSAPGGGADIGFTLPSNGHFVPGTK